MLLQIRNPKITALPDFVKHYSGDRQLNRALHMIIVTRRRTHEPTIAYIDRRIQEGKTRREATRCLKRYLARGLYRLLEKGAPTTS